MNRLIKYGIRTQAASVAVYSIINNNLSGIYCLIPWLVFELTGTLLFKEKPVAGLVLYMSAVLSSALVLNVYLFSGFTANSVKHRRQVQTLQDGGGDPS